MKHEHRWGGRAVALSALLGALLLTACDKDPVSTGPTNNPNVQVDLLFEKDGYSVYRFSDSGHNIYYVTPVGQVHTAWTQSCGKNCNREKRADSYTGAMK